MASPIRFVPISIAETGKVFTFMAKHYPPAYAHIWKDSGRWYLEQQYGAIPLTKALSEKDVYAYWCFAGNEVIGWTQWELKQAPDLHGKGAYLHRLYLATNAQGKGYGKQILIAFEAFAKTHEVSYVWLEAMNRGGAIKFYLRKQYQVIDSYRLNFERMLLEERGISILTKPLLSSM